MKELMDAGPQFLLDETPAPETQNPRSQPLLMGWLVLAAIFSLMIVSELSNYFARGVKHPNALSQTDQTRYELALKSVAMQIAASPDRTKLLEGDAVAQLAPLRLSNTEAARYYVLLRKELGQSIPPDTFAFLMRSKDATDRAVAGILQTDHLTKAQAAELTKAIVGTEFSDDLARAYAQNESGDSAALDKLHEISSYWGLILCEVAILFALVAGSFLLMLYSSRRTRLGPLSQGPVGLLSTASADRFAYRAGLCLSMYILLGVVLAKMPKGTSEWVAIGAECILTLLCYRMLSVPIEGIRESISKIGLTTKNLGPNILWGVGAAVANAPIVALLGYVSTTVFKSLPPPEHPIGKELMGSPSFGVVLPLFILAVVLAPFFEELTFRGLLLPALNGRLKSRYSAIFISSFLFAMIHPTGIPAWLPLAAVGGMSALLTYQTKSLVPSIVMHAVHNAATLAFVLLGAN